MLLSDAVKINTTLTLMRALKNSLSCSTYEGNEYFYLSKIHTSQN